MRPLDTTGDLVPLKPDQVEIVDSSRDKPELIRVEKIPVYVKTAVDLYTTVQKIKNIQKPDSTTTDKVLELGEIQEYGKSYSEPTRPRPIFDELLCGTNTSIPPDGNVGDLSYGTITPEDIQNIIELYFKIEIKTGKPRKDNPPIINYIAAEEPLCWKVISRFKEEKGGYPWEIHWDKSIIDDWPSYVSSLYSLYNNEKRFGRTGKMWRACDNWLD